MILDELIDLVNTIIDSFFPSIHHMNFLIVPFKIAQERGKLIDGYDRDFIHEMDFFRMQC